MPDVKYPCPCCGENTLPSPADVCTGFVCPNCGWEIDTFPPDEHHPSDQNGGISLAQARVNYKECGFCDPRIAEYL